MRGSRLWLPALVVTLAAAAVGCRSVTERFSSLSLAGDPSVATEAELSAGLASFAASFSSRVAAASDRIRMESKLRDTRRNTLLWQLRMVPLVRRSAFHPDVQQAYVATLALATAHEEYLSDGEGKALFGAQQSVAVEAAQQLEDEALELGKAFLTPRQIERLQTQVDDLVAKHPITGVFGADTLVSGFTESAAGGMFGWVVNLPMVPFRALAGVSDTAQAVSEFNDTARAFTETVAELPHQTRWELELLLYDAEELDTLERALAAGEAVALSAERMSSVAEKLPEELSAELARRLEEARGTISELDRALERAERLSGSLVQVSDRVGDASQQWTTLLTEMNASDGSGEDSRPFDIREYGDAASRIGDAGRELRELVADLRTVDPATGTSLLDAATWRGAALIAVFFAALTVYRVIVARLRS
jgi:hypothetical protein